MAAGPAASRFLHLETLRKRAEFLAVRGGARWATASLVLEAMQRPDATSGPPRFGYTVTKKLGNAVKRNRMRRRLKAAVLNAIRQGLARPGTDYVIVARSAALTRDFGDIETDLRVALEKVHKEPPGASGPRRPPGPRAEKAARPERRGAPDGQGG